MIIYGSKMYGKKDVVQGLGECDHCGGYGPHVSYTARKWGHLYFIPLIPAGPRVRVVKECKSCDHGLHLPETAVADTAAGIRETTDMALAALLAGQGEFVDDGETTACVPALVGAVELLYCLCEWDYVDQVLAALQQAGQMHAYHLVQGQALEFGGSLAEAAASYGQAAQLAPDDVLTLNLLGAACAHGGDFAGARAHYERALAVTSDTPPILLALLDVYAGMGDFPQVVQTYHRCFQVVPQLAEDKKVRKQYKKACKQAGLQPDPKWQ